MNYAQDNDHKWTEDLFEVRTNQQDSYKILNNNKNFILNLAISSRIM